MNDKAIGLLEQYDIQVNRTWKGRGAFLCDTDRGLLIFKEYIGPTAKAVFLKNYLSLLFERGEKQVEQILSNKEGELITYDIYKTPYILKTYDLGRECNYKSPEECEIAVKRLAKLHNVSDMKEYETHFGVPLDSVLPEYHILAEFEKHNKELKRVRRFLRDKGQKSAFEFYLLRHYDYFYDAALQVTEELKYYDTMLAEREKTIVCHGDYQYHNILVSEEGMFLAGFEKCCRDDAIRDLYLFMRKLLEKSNWSVELGEKLFDAYDKERSLTASDRIQLHYRLAYPEKFWKIVNYYFNNGKAWIPGKNMEKMEKLYAGEQDKQAFLEQTLAIKNWN